ncbi:MAG: helix-turn-helix transcriptional regulator [Acutalibacteraceae bacterium]|nr:helix-turn-helix transcriptional regulator [Acutalibacteraceae bacterium]
MSLKYKCDILASLKAIGITTYQIRKDKLLSESTVQKLRNKLPISWENIETLCKMLNCQPGDIIEYIPDNEG